MKVNPFLQLDLHAAEELLLYVAIKVERLLKNFDEQSGVGLQEGIRLLG